MFVQPSPEEEVHVGEDQDPRVRAFASNINAETEVSKIVILSCLKQCFLLTGNIS